MKRVDRDNEKLDVLELFSSMGRQRGYSLDDPKSEDDFIKLVQQLLQEGKCNPITVHGKRTEALFAYVAGALGQAQLVRHEDSGEIFHTGEKISAPDYRIVLKDGTQLLIEVKNCNHPRLTDKIKFRKNYVEKLKRYAEICGNQLRVAIYYRGINRWALVSFDVMEENSESYTISFIEAFAKSEMALLGDCMIATTPKLELVLKTGKDEGREVSEDGQALFVTREIRFFCDGNEIIDESEKAIAFYFMLYSDWIEERAEAVLENNRLQALRFVYAPESPSDDQKLQIIGTLSGMITRGYRDRTVREGKVFALTSKVEPNELSVFIPENYTSERLPLWRFVIQPNNSFKLEA